MVVASVINPFAFRNDAALARGPAEPLFGIDAHDVRPGHAVEHLVRAPHPGAKDVVACGYRWQIAGSADLPAEREQPVGHLETLFGNRIDDHQFFARLRERLEPLAQLPRALRELRLPLRRGCRAAFLPVAFAVVERTLLQEGWDSRTVDDQRMPESGEVTVEFGGAGRANRVAVPRDVRASGLGELDEVIPVGSRKPSQVFGQRARVAVAYEHEIAGPRAFDVG